MPLTLLFDLDDTLLDTNLESFVPAYFQALSSHLGKRVPGEIMIRALADGTKAMYANEDPQRTLQEVFDAEFYPKIGIRRDELSDVVDDFYERVFPVLGKHTKQKPEAGPLIEWAISCGYRIVIATDPLFPSKATYHRLRWAGLDPEKFELISTFESFHFSKSHPSYYAEVLGRLGWPDGSVLMVGNDVNRDLIPAHQLGLKTFFIETGCASGPGFEAGGGKLADLRPWLDSINLSTLEPSYKSRESILGIMASTPAVLQSLFSAKTGDGWKHKPARNEWSLNEIVCHLRDAEREVYSKQLELLLEKAGAFIPRPDTEVWASERDYQNEDGATAIADFAHTRLVNLEKLKRIEQGVWLRPARHAIFGPTDFLEIMNFVADHDRLHLQQAWRLLQNTQVGASN